MRYSTSWSDGFVNWLKKFPGPYWVSCLIPGLCIFLINLYFYRIANPYLVSASDVTQTTLIILSLMLGFGVSYSIYILGRLPAKISSYLHKIRPILKVSEEQYKTFHDKMTFQNTPGGMSWLGQRLALLFTIITLVSVWLTVAGAYLQIVLFILVFVLSLLLLIFLSALVLIKITTVLRGVNQLQYQPLDVNILNPYPLFAISRLTQMLAVSVLPMATVLGFLGISMGLSTWRTYASLGNLPSLGEITILISLLLLGPALLLISISIFIVPVLWIRRLIIQKKDETLEQLAAGLQTTFAEYSRRTASGELFNVGDLKASVDFLTAQEQRFRRIAEWPWEGRVFREFIGALVIPIVLWALQAYLENFIRALMK